MSKEIHVSKKSTKKAKDLSPSSLEGLVNQVFDKSKQLNMSVKEQRKLVQEYLNAKIEDSDDVEEGYGSESDSDSDCDSEDDEYSDFEGDSYSESEEETEESSEESESESSEDDEEAPTVASKIPERIVIKTRSDYKSDQDAKKSVSSSKVKEEEPDVNHLEAYVTPSKSSTQPASRIQRRVSMAGALAAPSASNSLANTEGNPKPSKSEKA
ncbi:bifunctional lysine-specific demethylase and histidyl-hydroxylase NO66 [Drosophila eugracilis]|uniref:bifunctional lysine-specific demethylase and histidyl-hydroxylase NO66 n=1 Tax=Drosophila eugracilis TaxID=29029 RepID=UPI001BD97BEE|nr:bifunctional lysine-specific demethylase and histidyl-hydroxylase NO66 [Drosophila eugracilis]